MSETQTTAGETGPATYDETFRTLCIALGWAYTPDAGFESVAIAAEAAAHDLLWQKSQRAEAGRMLQRVTAERDELRAAVNCLLSAMETQEGREREEMHIPQEVMLRLWNEAKEKARTVLSRIEDR